MKRIIAALVVLLSLTVMSVEYVQADQLFWTREVQPTPVGDGDPYWPTESHGPRVESDTSDTEQERSLQSLRLLIIRLMVSFAR